MACRQKPPPNETLQPTLAARLSSSIRCSREIAEVVKHIVFWTLKESAVGRTAPENALEIKSRLEALNGRIPGLLELEVGIDFGRTDASADVALYSVFVDRDALDGYQAHPEHVAVADFVGEVRLERMVVDYEI